MRLPFPIDIGRLVALVVALMLASVALAASLPALTGRVVDNAGIIDAATEALLVAKLEAFERKSSDQIVVATIGSLEGEAIEPYANRLFRAWGLGHAGENNGVLILVAVNDRHMRIEVGYGLEGTLTDLHAKLIIENTMVPAFRAGDFSGGISRAVDDIILVLEGNAAELEARARRNEDSVSVPEIAFFGLFVLVALFSVGSAIFSLLAMTFGKRVGTSRYRFLGIDVSTAGGSASGRRSGGSSSRSSFSGRGGSSGGGGSSGRW